MNAHKLSASIFLVGSLSLFSACEREAVGETYASQVNGGSTVELSWDSPPRGSTHIANAPATLPEYQIRGTVPASEPAIHALLGTSGSNMRDNVPLVHLPDLAAIAAAEAEAVLAAAQLANGTTPPAPPPTMPPGANPMPPEAMQQRPPAH